MNAAIRSGRGPLASTIFPKKGPLRYTPTKIILKGAKKKSEMAYCFQQRRTRLAWYVRDGDGHLIAEGMLEKARVEYVDATK
jgi:hypothetical protein